ncbi:MAG: AarF/ABC1/UbiB kinase family protein [Cyanobacteria bacterium P01_H01_bin.121]
MADNRLEQLTKYDYRVIADYYRFRIWRSIWRTLRITFYFGSFCLALLFDRWFEREDANKHRRATQLREVLTALGPTFIKVGQALSTRPDLVRVDFLDELTKLQDRLPPFPNELAFAIIENELDRTVDEAYREISRTPVAAASLGQVYKARLYNGDQVAVKVQRPNLLPTLTLDLYLIRWAAGWLEPWLPLNLGHDLTLIVDEFGTKLFEEIDYINEGRNAERFASNFQACDYVKVPSIYWRYTSRHVLTLEWIEGYKLAGAGSLNDKPFDADAVVRLGVISGLQQLLEFGFFHADPHPGNLFAVPANQANGNVDQMAYIDFGMMDQLNQRSKEKLVDAVVHLINKEYDELAIDFIELGFLAPGTDIKPIVPALESVLGDVMGERVRDFNFKTVTDRFSEMMYEYPFRVPAKFALIIRSIVTQEGLALSVNPDFRIVEVAYPYVARRLITGETPELRRRLLAILFKDGKFRWDRLESMLKIARTEADFDLLPTAQLGLSYLMSEEGSNLRQQLLLAMVEDDRIHTDEVRRLWDLIKDDIKPDRILNSAMNSAVGALVNFSRERAASIFPAIEVLN